MVVFGSNEMDNETRLKKVLQLLKDKNVLLNEDKCVYRVKEI